MQILVHGVWKIACCLENGGSMLVGSLCVFLRLALNQGQHPWESNPEGVIRSCRSSVENREGKCTCGFSIACLPLVQALTKGERVIRKSSGWGISVVQSLFVFFFLLFSHSFIPFMGRLVMGFFVMSCLLQCSVDFKSVFSYTLCTHFFSLCVKTPIPLAELVLVLYLAGRCEGFLPFFVAKANLSDTLAEARKQLLVFHL